MEPQRPGFDNRGGRKWLGNGDFPRSGGRAAEGTGADGGVSVGSVGGVGYRDGPAPARPPAIPPRMFDLVGDVHGCDDELVALLGTLGHPLDPRRSHPHGRRLVFVGDLVDRGPATPAVLRRVMTLVAAGRALCVAGNHDVRLAEALRGIAVEPGHGLEESLAQLAAEPESFRTEAAAFIESLPGHLVLDDGRLVVAHAGLDRRFHGQATAEARDRAIHGAYTGTFDERPMPVRDDWAARHDGSVAVVQGHTPVAEAEWFNETICIDTACVYGGRLTALAWPERRLVSVPAIRPWARSARGALPPRAVARRAVREPAPLLPSAGDAVARLRGAAARLLERGAPGAAVAAPRSAYVVYLPPTMSACDPSREGRALEHPLVAMAQYAAEGLRSVVCQEKHAGVRAVAVVCRDAAAARRRFGVDDSSAGAVHSRFGRAVLAPDREGALLAGLRVAAERSGTWERLETDWLCLDGEWLEGPRPGGEFATFHLLAAERRTFFDRGHDWHLAELAGIAAAADPGPDGTGPSIRVTRHLAVDLERPVDVAAAIAWWHDLGTRGGEGIVVKPAHMATAGIAGPTQPALKVRAEPWLGKVYGEAARDREGLESLRGRSLTTKRARAIDQFALGVEALERFVGGAGRPAVDACLDRLLEWSPRG